MCISCKTVSFIVWDIFGISYSWKFTKIKKIEESSKKGSRGWMRNMFFSFSLPYNIKVTGFVCFPFVLGQKMYWPINRGVKFKNSQTGANVLFFLNSEVKSEAAMKKYPVFVNLLLHTYFFAKFKRKHQQTSLNDFVHLFTKQKCWTIVFKVLY